MDFGDAIRALKAGKRVARSGWNGRGMWLCYMPDVVIPEGLVNGRTKTFWPKGDLPVGGYIVMRTAQGIWQPGWLANQADMLSTDWVEVLSLEEGFARAEREIAPGEYIACKLEQHRDGEDLFVVEHRATVSDEWPASKTLSPHGDGLVRMTKAAVTAEIRPELAREFLVYARRGR